MTIDGIRFVADSGKVNEMGYAAQPPDHQLWTVSPFPTKENDS